MSYNSRCFDNNCYWGCCDSRGYCPVFEEQCSHYYSSSGLSGGGIVGIAVAAALVCCFLICLTIYCCKRCADRRRDGGEYPPQG